MVYGKPPKKWTVDELTLCEAVILSQDPETWRKIALDPAVVNQVTSKRRC